MNKSESIVNLTKALLKAQKKIENAVKDSTNPHFRSNYAGLPEVLEACKEHLNEAGIVVMQMVNYEESGDFLETIIFHADTSEFISSKMRLILDKASMQAAGSAITYARRYALQSMVFMSSVDDDGNAADAKKAPEKKYIKTTKEIGDSFRKQAEKKDSMPF
jgi:hypothetical protein